MSIPKAIFLWWCGARLNVRTYSAPVTLAFLPERSLFTHAVATRVYSAAERNASASRMCKYVWWVLRNGKSGRENGGCVCGCVVEGCELVLLTGRPKTERTCGAPVTLHFCLNSRAMHAVATRAYRAAERNACLLHVSAHYVMMSHLTLTPTVVNLESHV